jgi:hypothetical protein
VGDAQHPAPYCSAPCTRASDCAAGLSCIGAVCAFAQRPAKGLYAACGADDFCLGGAVCTGPAAVSLTRCVLPCTTQSDCAASEQCEGGAGGSRYCRPPESVAPFSPVSLALAHTQGEAARGCAAAPGGALVGWMALALGCRRRRR